MLVKSLQTAIGSCFFSRPERWDEVILNDGKYFDDKIKKLFNLLQMKNCICCHVIDMEVR
jgi:hypothetical protein